MAIEWGFLILLAVGAAVADLRPIWIILVMLVGWVLVVLVELLAWRARPGYVVEEPEPEPAPAAAAPAAFREGPREDGELPPLQPPIPPSYDFEFTPPAPVVSDDTAVSESVPAAEEAEEEERPALHPDDPYAPAPERERLQEADQRTVHRLEPLKPRPKRRWFGRA